MPPGYGSFAATLINLFDCSTLLITCLSLTFLTNDIDVVFKAYLYVNIVAMVLYFALIPESPSWLFFHDNYSRQGINALKYIAWFNGSEFKEHPGYDPTKNKAHVTDMQWAVGMRSVFD